MSQPMNYYANLSINDWCADRDDKNLSLEEEGLLFRMSLLGFRRLAHLLDDDAQTAKMVHLDVRPYRRLLAGLITSGLVERLNGKLVIRCVSEAIAAAEKRRRDASEGGRKSATGRTSARHTGEHPADLPADIGEISAPKCQAPLSNVNDLAPTTPYPSPKPIPKPRKGERALSPVDNFEIEQGSAESANVVAFRKADECDDWSLPEEWKAYALERGLSENEVASDAITFRAKNTDLSFKRWQVWVQRALDLPGRQSRAAWGRAMLLPSSSFEESSTPESTWDWRTQLSLFQQTGRWIGDKPGFHWCGPKPGEPGCKAPAAVLAEFGLAQEPPCVAADVAAPQVARAQP